MANLRTSLNIWGFVVCFFYFCKWVPPKAVGGVSWASEDHISGFKRKQYRVLTESQVNPTTACWRRVDNCEQFWKWLGKRRKQMAHSSEITGKLICISQTNLCLYRHPKPQIKKKKKWKLLMTEIIKSVCAIFTGQRKTHNIIFAGFFVQ